MLPSRNLKTVFGHLWMVFGLLITKGSCFCLSTKSYLLTAKTETAFFSGFGFSQYHQKVGFWLITKQK